MYVCMAPINGIKGIFEGFNWRTADSVTQEQWLSVDESMNIKLSAATDEVAVPAIKDGARIVDA